MRVFFQGSFDLLHYGHIRAIQRAKEHGKILIIGLNTDKLYKSYKKKIPVIHYSYRKRMLEAIKGVTKVVPVSILNPLYYLKKYDIDVYVMCNEWIYNKMAEIKYMKEKGGKVVVLPYLKSISTSHIRHKIIENHVKHNIKYCAKCHRTL